MEVARILAVAVVVEAMAYHRPYRPAIGLNAALTYENRLRNGGPFPATIKLINEAGQCGVCHLFMNRTHPVPKYKSS